MINLKRVDHDPGLFATPRLEWGTRNEHSPFSTTLPVPRLSSPRVAFSSGNRRSFQHLRHPRQLRLVSICNRQRLVASLCVSSYGDESLPGTIREHPGNIQGTFREHSGHLQGTFRDHSGTIQGPFREHSMNIQGTFMEHSWNIP